MNRKVSQKSLAFLCSIVLHLMLWKNLSVLHGVTGKYYVSKKETPVLKAYVRKGVRGEGENFIGNFKWT